ncbi:hypothetical protein BH09MYX1_BH09MYX1_64780 [soil metagenome]
MTTPKLSRHPPPTRDQDESSFATILKDLLRRVPGAIGVALVDRDGEAVDYTGRLSPFDMKVAAAHFRILLDDVSRSSLGAPRSIVCRGTKRTYLARVLPDAYALVIAFSRRAGFVVADRAFIACERALAVEAEWPIVNHPFWLGVDVERDARRRPVKIRAGTASSAVDVLGTLVGLRRGERGFRIRLIPSGHELNLVRERGGSWFVDESIAQS